MLELENAAPTAPLVRVWDKDFNLIGHVGEGWRVDEPSVLAVPLEHPIAQWLLSNERLGPVFLTADYGGLRNIAGLQELVLTREEFGDGFVKLVKATFVSDRLPRLLNWPDVVESQS